MCTITTPPPGMSEGHSDHDHTHPGHGPHEGELIELGNEEYHAELIHDDKSVTIYILDGAATKAVPIEAKELVVNLKHEGKPEQFKLVATPDAGDESGKSSKFSSADPELAGHLDEKEADAKLVVEINGKSFRGSLAHDHDHGHEHK
ncbi:hypothetical protein [Planctomicrobium piriforme]|uniref:hypothetical protein n=1 Tax=Planctomicrobium piriforme TaxID=1576369 RepID=UPI001C318E3A|nr:hypothetical protein [Planctomicrobium piriforme]